MSTENDPPANAVFAPRVREPWVNPAKRRSALLLGIAAAVVLLVLGGLIGAGLSGGHGRGFGERGRGGESRYQRIDRSGHDRLNGHDGLNRHGRPGHSAVATSAPTSAPTSIVPAPSSSHS